MSNFEVPRFEPREVYFARFRDFIDRIRLGPPDREKTRVSIERIRSVEEKDLVTILKWSEHPQVQGHLDPAPIVPHNWKNRLEVQRAVGALRDYYRNYPDNPKKITSMVALDKNEQLLGVLTIRWRGDPYVPEGQGISSIERIIVNPDRHREGIGTTLVATAIEHARSKGSKEVRAWIMEDDKAGDWRKNWKLFRKFGFQVVPNAPHWREFAAKRGFNTEGRDATWFRLRFEWYDLAKQREPRIKPCAKIDLAS